MVMKACRGWQHGATAGLDHLEDTQVDSHIWHYLHYPEKGMVPEESEQSFLGCAADQAPRCSPTSAPIWAPQRTERAMFPNEGGASVRTWLTPSSPRNTNFVLHSKNSPQQRQVTSPFSSLLWASPWSLQCSHRNQNGHMESATQRLEQQEIHEGFQCFLQLLNDCNSSRWPSITAPQASGWCPEAAWC